LNEYPELKQPFKYNGVFYPTENLKQLLVAVSAMPIDKQVEFRRAIVKFKERLEDKVSAVTGKAIRLSKGDIVLTHYSLIGLDDGFTLEGFVSANGKPYNYKGFIDLVTPRNSDVFVASNMNRKPANDEIAALKKLNNAITAAGGEIAPEGEAGESPVHENVPPSQETFPPSQDE
jgi:hypothetical protein